MRSFLKDLQFPFFLFFNIQIRAIRVCLVRSVSGLYADTASESGSTAALTCLFAVRGNRLIFRLLPFSLQERTGDTAVQEIPGQDLVQGSFSVGIEIRIQTAGSEGFHPDIIVEVFAPGIVEAALVINI